MKSKEYTNETVPCTINGTTFEVDILLYDLIVRLNQLGYKTKFCCSGHRNIHDAYQLFYIMFDENISIQHRANLRSIAEKLDLYYEKQICIDTSLTPNNKYSESNIWITNPTYEQLTKCIESLLLKNYHSFNKSDINKEISITSNIILRKIPMTDFVDLTELTKTEQNQLIEENFRTTIEIINKLYNILDDYIIA